MILGCLPFHRPPRSFTSAFGHDPDCPLSRRLAGDRAAATLLPCCVWSRPAGAARFAHRACRSCATPKSRHWCVTMRGRSSRRPGFRRSGIDIILVNDRALQRLRRRTPHVHQHRRAAEGGNAQRDHRRDRPREPATSPAATSSGCATSWRARRPWRSSPRCSASAPSRRARPPTAAALAQAGMGIAAGGGGSGAPRPARLPAHRGEHSRPFGDHLSRKPPANRPRAC